MKLNLKLRTLMVATLGVISLMAVGCDDADGSSTYGAGQVYFTGTIYSGPAFDQASQSAAAGPLTNYTITLQYAGVSIQGIVDPVSGRYRVGPLEPFHDYTIVVEAPGYETLESTNPMARPFVESREDVALGELLRNHDDEYDDSVTADEMIALLSIYDRAFEFNFVGYLIPADLPVSVGFSFNAEGARSNIAPSDIDGQLYLQPVSNAPQFFGDDSAQTPQAQEEASEYRFDILQINRQYWKNDAVELNGPVVVNIVNGEATATQAEGLIYGITYEATVFLSSGLQFNSGDVFTAGRTEFVSIDLDQTTIPALQVVYNSAAYGPTPAGQNNVTIVFNQDVALISEDQDARDGNIRGSSIAIDETILEILDDNFSITATQDGVDVNNGGLVDCLTVHDFAIADGQNPAEFDPDNVIRNENGVSFSLNQNVLTISWNGNLGQACGERIEKITFGGLGSIFVRPLSSENIGATRSLGTLLGFNNVALAAVTVTFDQGR